LSQRGCASEHNGYDHCWTSRTVSDVATPGQSWRSCADSRLDGFHLWRLSNARGSRIGTVERPFWTTPDSLHLPARLSGWLFAVWPGRNTLAPLPGTYRRWSDRWQLWRPFLVHRGY